MIKNEENYSLDFGIQLNLDHIEPVIYDIKERLAAKGFSQKPLKIIEICSGKYANQFLNKNRLISLCMPCKINVLDENGKVKIVGMKPTMISQFFSEVDRKEAEQVERDVIEMVDNAR